MAEQRANETGQDEGRQKTSLSLTPATAVDEDYLYGLTEAVMRAYVEATWGAWNEADSRSRVAAGVAAGRCSLVYVDDVRAGVIMVDDQLDHVALERIYIEPAFQRCGVGTRLLVDLMARARTARKPLRLRVLAVNPAKRLYDRLGFVVVDTDAQYFYMEHR